MAGLFSGLGLSSKKENKPKNKLPPNTEAKSATTNSTKSGDSSPQKESLKNKKAKDQDIKPTVKKNKANIDTRHITNNTAKKDTPPQKPADHQTNTSKQPTSERSPSMRLSKNAPKKVDNDFDISAETIAPSPTYTSSSTSIGTKVEPKITPCATIGPKTSFKGELSGEEDLLVQGYVEGTITLKNNHLTIGKLGTVKANVEAKTITVEGTVQGDITGQEKVIITATSNVDGNLKAERVILEDGAKFRGSIDMGSSATVHKTAESSNVTQTVKATQQKTPTMQGKAPEKQGTA